MAANPTSAPIPYTPAASTPTDPKNAGDFARYAAYGGRIRTILLAGSRYLAFTSDVGEAFRPVFPPKLVTATYAISWLYCGSDVAYHGYQSYKNGESTNDIQRIVAQRTVFQSVASMGLPALTIHTTVDVVSKLCQKYGRFQKWGGTVAGLAAIPFLPIFDEPVEHATEYLFDKFWARDGPSVSHEKKEH